MSRSSKVGLAILLAVLLLIPTIASAQGPERIIIVNSFTELKQYSVQAGERILFQLAECSENEAICSIEMWAGDSLTDSAVQLRGSSGTIQCGMNYYNHLGAHIATLQESQDTCFYDQYGKAPFHWIGLPNVSTWAALLYEWGGGASSINPGSGVRSDIGTSITSRTLYYLGQSTGHAVQITFSGAGQPSSCTGF